MTCRAIPLTANRTITPVAFFLTTGRMLRPPAIDVPSIPLPAVTDIPYSGAAYPASTSPAVIGSLWQGPNGDAGYWFTNLSHDPVQFDLAIDAASTLLPPQEEYLISLIRNGVASVVQTSAALPSTVTVSVDPMDVVLVRASPSTNETPSCPGSVTAASPQP